MAILNTCTNFIFDKCYFGQSAGHGIYGVSVTNSIIRNSFLFCAKGGTNYGLTFGHATGASNTANLVQNCVLLGGAGGVRSDRVGGISVNNCSVLFSSYGVRVNIALPAGQTIIVTNSIFHDIGTSALIGTAAGQIIEDYNSFSNNAADRTNTDTGAHSNTYPPLFDSRWFFELAAKSQKLLTPFDLSSASKLIDVAGTSPATTDLRNQAVIGAQREWGALEYNSALSKGVGISRGRSI